MRFMNFDTGIILAAGLGTRLRPLTLDLPKPLIPMNCEKTFLDHAIANLRQIGIKKIVINTHYLPEKVRAHLNKYHQHVEIILSHEPVLLGSGGGIRQAFSFIPSHPYSIILNADIYLGQEENGLLPLVNAWDPKKMDFLALLKDKSLISVEFKGDFNLTSSGQLIRDDEHNQHVLIGAYILKVSIFDGYAHNTPFPITDIIFKEIAREKHNFYGVITNATWFDIGTPSRLEDLRMCLKNQRAR